MTAKKKPRRTGSSDRPTVLVNDSTLNSSNKIFTVPAGEDWEILSVFGYFATTATVGNRLLSIHVFNASGALLAAVGGGIYMAASGTANFTAAPGMSHNNHDGGGGITMPLPALVLPSGYSIRVLDVKAIDPAADDLTVRILGVQRTR